MALDRVALIGGYADGTIDHSEVADAASLRNGDQTQENAPIDVRRKPGTRLADQYPFDQVSAAGDWSMDATRSLAAGSSLSARYET